MGIPIWFVTVVLNVPLFIVSIKLLGIRTMINVTIGTLTYIIAMMVIPIYDLQFDDMLLSSVVGGINRNWPRDGVFSLLIHRRN